MEFLKVLEEFDDLYMLCDLIDGKILEMVPQIPSIRFPCNILNVFRLKKFNLDIDSLRKIEIFLKTANKSDCINVKGSKGWYSLDIRHIEENQCVLHLYNIDASITKLNTALSQSQLDSLTGVLQKNAIEIYIDSYFKENKNTQSTIFMLDVDYFKNINDNYGHLFGDKVIMAVADTLKELAGDSGKVGRIGGDEFILFVQHDLDRLGMKNIARLIRYGLDNLIIDGKPFSCTTTIGICQYPKNGTTFKELYSCCDKALYRGKEKGRDCHIIYDPLIHLGAIAGADTKGNDTVVNKLSLPSFIGVLLKHCLNDDLKDPKQFFTDIADFFNLDRIVSYKKDGTAVIRYCREENDNNVESYQRFPFESYEKNFIIDDMFYINDTKTWKIKDTEIFDIFEEANTISVVQVLTTDENENTDGFISYEMLHARRVWQRGELNAFAIISKIINIYRNDED